MKRSFSEHGIFCTVLTGHRFSLTGCWMEELGIAVLSAPSHPSPPPLSPWQGAGRSSTDMTSADTALDSRTARPAILVHIIWVGVMGRDGRNGLTLPGTGPRWRWGGVGWGDGQLLAGRAVRTRYPPLLLLGCKTCACAQLQDRCYTLPQPRLSHTKVQEPIMTTFTPASLS